MIMGEEKYMDEDYCLECAVKHSRDVEHHLEDLVTGAPPELKGKALELKEKARQLRKEIDSLRVLELAKKLKDVV
jgi:hypothetical protein